MLSADVCHLSFSLRCCCSASQQAWHRLIHGRLSYGGWAAAAQWTPLSVSVPRFFCVSWAMTPIAFLTRCLLLLPFFCLSPHLLFSLRPCTSLSHTLVATLKTVVAMVTAMCCGNVKEPKPPGIASLFISLKFYGAVSFYDF